MTRTYLVALNIPDSIDLLGLADDISADLTSAGHDVESVKPWAPHEALTLLGQTAKTPVVEQQPPSIT